jgi:hypothetical protein
VIAEVKYGQEREPTGLEVDRSYNGKYFGQVRWRPLIHTWLQNKKKEEEE